MVAKRAAIVLVALYGLAGCDDNAGDAQVSATAPQATPAAQVETASQPAAGGAIAAPDELRALATGQMANMIVHDEPRPFRDKKFLTEEGQETDLSRFRGQVTLLNLWATWCPPCRAEMPDFDALQKELGTDGFQVVALSLDRGGARKARGFFDEVGVTTLDAYVDPKSQLAREMAVLNLPVTVILDHDAREIARLTGPAKWSSDEAKAMVRAAAGLD